MATITRPSLLPFCSSCTRRLTETALDGWRPFQQHVRGKKKMVNNSRTVTVRLQEDVRTFGRKSSLVQIPRGMMRNYWHTKGLAAYVPQLELKQLLRSGVSLERDVTFGVLGAEDEVGMTSRDVKDALSKSKMNETKVDMLPPLRTHDLLSIFLPSTLPFERTARQGVGDSKDSAEAQDTRHTTEDVTPLYGSVTLQDIIEAIRGHLSHNPEASRVQPSELQLKFIFTEGMGARHSEGGAVDTEDRIKHVGEYELQIKVRGYDGEPIRRKIRVGPTKREPSNTRTDA